MLPQTNMISQRLTTSSMIAILTERFIILELIKWKYLYVVKRLNLNLRPALQWHFLLRWVFSGPGNKKPRTLKVKLGTSHTVIIPPTLSVLWLDYGGLRWPLLSSIGLEWPRTFTYWDPSCRPQKYLRRHPRPERQQGWSGPTPPRPRWKISQTSINGCPQAKRTGQQTE